MPPKLESNPAQRLYEMLEKHATILPKHGNSGLWAVWKAVLEVSDEDFLSEFTAAFALIGQIDQALHVTGDVIQRRAFELHKEAWRQAFIPQGSGVGQGVQQGDVNEYARNALGGIASHLRDNLPEGRVPTEQDVADLRDMVRKAVDELTDDESIPLPVRDLLLRRLHDVLWAVDHVRVMGADGIAAACDRLAVAMTFATRSVDVPKTGLFFQLKDIIIKGYAAIGFADTVYGGFQAWQAIEPLVGETLRQIAQ